VSQESQHGDAVMEAIVKSRNGSVLGKGSILKKYFFPGQRTSSHIQIDGAPPVYKVCCRTRLSKLNFYIHYDGWGQHYQQYHMLVELCCP